MTHVSSSLLRVLSLCPLQREALPDREDLLCVLPLSLCISHDKFQPKQPKQKCNKEQYYLEFVRKNTTTKNKLPKWIGNEVKPRELIPSTQSSKCFPNHFRILCSKRSTKKSVVIFLQFYKLQTVLYRICNTATSLSASKNSKMLSTSPFSPASNN